MYCTLQEAYNIPAFDPAAGKKKRTCAGTLPPQAQMQQQQQPMQQLQQQPQQQQGYRNMNMSMKPLAQQQSQQQCPSGTAEDVDAYNNFVKPQEYAAANNQYTREDFVGGFNNSGNNAQSNRDQAGGYFDTNTPYASQGLDYKYYCDNYKICPKAPINTSENFANNIPSNTNTPGNTAPVYVQPPNGQMQTGPTSLQTPNPNSPSPSQNGNPQTQQCSPLQAPIYEIPISDAAKEAYSEAMNVSLNQESPNYPAAVPAARVYDMNKVGGYYDDDLEQYLKTSNVATNKTVNVKDTQASYQKSIDQTSVANANPTPNVDTPLSNAMKKYDNQQLGIPTEQSKQTLLPTQEQPYPSNRQNTDGTGTTVVASSTSIATSTPVTVEKSDNIKKIDYILDIVLFILIGVLIILLCDQIFKAAMVYGMKETMRMVNPYLQEYHSRTQYDVD